MERNTSLHNVISKIEYDLLGNPKKVSFADHSITEYVYAADGRRLKTVHRTSVPRSERLHIGNIATLPQSETASVDSTEYFGNFIFENNVFNQYHFEGGYMAGRGTPANYRYYVKDHLGNNRIVAKGDGTVEQHMDYYPYGGHLSFSTDMGYQKYKYNGKEYDPMHGLNEYDYGARRQNPVVGQFTSMDPLCEKYYHLSPYSYCGGNPVNRVDPDGSSTWVINLSEGRYKVVGGNLEDNDRNVLVGSFNKKGVFVPQYSIGISSSITSFYNSDKGEWAKGSIINVNDKSGDQFLANIISNNPPMFDDYMANARNNKPYDFKVTNGTGMKYKENSFYRGMPIGITGDGQVIYSSARDIGNISAGYVAATNGMSWEASRLAFDAYQGGIESMSTRNAEWYGWRMGYNNTTHGQKRYNLLKSLDSAILSLFNIFVK